MIHAGYTQISKLLKRTNHTTWYGRSTFSIAGILLILSAPLFYLLFSDASLLYTLFIGTWVISLILGNEWLLEQRKQFWNELSQTNKALIKSIEHLDSIEIILEKLESINVLLKKLKHNLWFTDWMYSDEIHRSHEELFWLELVFLSQILTDLEKDLEKQVQENIENLTETKDSIPTLDTQWQKYSQLVEIQKIRLEKQIGEFKKLEKILIKV